MSSVKSNTINYKEYTIGCIYCNKLLTFNYLDSVNITGFDHYTYITDSIYISHSFRYESKEPGLYSGIVYLD